MKNQEVPCIVLTSYCEEGSPATRNELTKYADEVTKAIRTRRYLVERTPEGFLAWHPAGFIIAYENPSWERRRKVVVRNFKDLALRPRRQQQPKESTDPLSANCRFRGYLFKWNAGAIPLDHDRAEMLDEDWQQLVDFSWEGYSV